MRIFALLVLTLLLFSLKVQAQNDSISPKGLTDYLQGGSLQAEIRNYLMHTDNQNRRLNDAYANALGAAFQYQSMRYQGWQVGFTGSFVYNTWSNDLGKPDSLTGQFNRYEIGLFDLNDPYKAFIGRVDELYLAYHFGQSLVRVGKQKLNTPWLNPQDGRMRPNFQEGIYMKMNEISKLQIEAAWIYQRMAQRGRKHRSVPRRHYPRRPALRIPQQSAQQWHCLGGNHLSNKPASQSASLVLLGRKYFSYGNAGA